MMSSHTLVQEVNFRNFHLALLIKTDLISDEKNKTKPNIVVMSTVIYLYPSYASGDQDDNQAMSLDLLHIL